MSQLKNFLAKLSLKAILDTEITPQKVQVPTKIDTQSFYRDHKAQIETTGLTTEKALYVASAHQSAPHRSATDMLYGHFVKLD